MRPTRPLPRCLAALLFSGICALTLSACVGNPSKEQEEAAKNTIACQYSGDRVVIRFDAGEARMLIGGDRVTLYQIPSGSGVRYTNGLMELRGKGMDMQLVREGTAVALSECQPYVVPK